MASYLKYSNPRVPKWLLLLLLLPLFGFLVYRHWSGVPYVERAARSEAQFTMQYMAQELRKADEARVRAATVESLFGTDKDRFGNTFGLELAGTAPNWAGTRLYTLRAGREIASLTITSMYAGTWTTQTEEPPTRWELWWE